MQVKVINPKKVTTVKIEHYHGKLNKTASNQWNPKPALWKTSERGGNKQGKSKESIINHIRNQEENIR